MLVRIAKSINMPTLYSYFISQFGQAALELLKDRKPFTRYHADTKEYECIEQVYKELQKYETYEVVLDERKKQTLKPFQRRSTEEYGYQNDAVNFALERSDIFVNFPQGMGKSFTTMRILTEKHINKALIVCGQGNLQEEWLKDAKKHQMTEKLNLAIIGNDTNATTAKKLKWLASADQGHRTDLINIEALRNVSIVEALNKQNYDCIVVDEVQSAKGWKAEQTKGLHELIRTPGQTRIALSGTPILNNPLEFFSLVRFFGMLTDTARTTFEKYYGIWEFDRWGHYICTGYKHLNELNELIQPVLVYASKDELHLPPKRRKKIDLPLKDTERFDDLAKLYKSKSKRKITEAGYKTKQAIRADMIFLSCTAPEKVEFIKNLHEKALVFSQYTTVLEHYKDELEKAGKKVLYYSGELKMDERLEVLNEWGKGETDVLLLSTMASRYGLNLTQAKTVVTIEPPTSLSILEQTEDRAWRIGQTEPVTSYLLCSTVLDEDALDSIAAKQEALDKLNDLK